MTIYLGVETSCDETAAAVVRDGREVLASRLSSQIELHNEFGGVVPEVAARCHLETINEIIELTLADAQVDIRVLDGISCTVGPGLVGTLLVGLSAAKALSWAWDLPLIAVDHLLAHICANYLNSDLEPPFVALLVSGGHTQIIYCKDYGQGQIIGQSIDDAAGEAYDKVARLLGLGYPGGPMLDRLAAKGNPRAFKFPEGVVPGFDFSFSGLKTAVLRCVEKLSPPLPLADLAASFQEAITSVLVRKTINAQKVLGAKSIVLAGGVAANRELRAKFQANASVPVFYPAVELCTDNAAMVASAAFFCGRQVPLDVGVYSRQS